MNRSEIYYLFQFEIKIRINILTNNINKHLKRKEKSSKKEKKKKILLRLPFFMTQLVDFSSPHCVIKDVTTMNGKIGTLFQKKVTFDGKVKFTDKQGRKILNVLPVE